MAVSENIDKYRVYVIRQKKSGSEIIKPLSTETPFFSCASAAFRELYKLPFDKNHLVLMTKNNQQINSYRYESLSNDRDFWDENMELRR